MIVVTIKKKKCIATHSYRHPYYTMKSLPLSLLHDIKQVTSIKISNITLKILSVSMPYKIFWQRISLKNIIDNRDWLLYFLKKTPGGVLCLFLSHTVCSHPVDRDYACNYRLIYWSFFSCIIALISSYKKTVSLTCFLIILFNYVYFEEKRWFLLHYVMCVLILLPIWL